MLDILRIYFIRPIWENLFVYFPMPLRAILILVALALFAWIILRFGKELFRSFLEILLLPEYFLARSYRRRNEIFPNGLKYGDVLNNIALAVIPIRPDQKINKLSITWIVMPSLILLALYPVWNFREFLQVKSPAESAVLKWGAFEDWIIAGRFKEPANYYFDFYVHQVRKGENLAKIVESYNKPPDLTVSPEDVSWANEEKYPALKASRIESDWILIIPVRKTLEVINKRATTYRVKTSDQGGLQVRSKKDVNSASVTYVPEGGEVVVLHIEDKTEEINGKPGKWYRVKANGTEGWALGISRGSTIIWSRSAGNVPVPRR